MTQAQRFSNLLVGTANWFAAGLAWTFAADHQHSFLKGGMVVGGAGVFLVGLLLLVSGIFNID